jgi:YHS domain-containing protein
MYRCFACSRFVRFFVFAWFGVHAIPAAELRDAYGSRVNAGFGVFLTLRPAVMMHMDHMGHEAAPGVADHSQHTAAHPVDHSQHVPAAPASTSRPADGGTPAPGAAAGGEPRLPVAEAERVIDPGCAATIDLVNVPKAIYERKVYYFCSTPDRDEFVKDPAAYLKKRGNHGGDAEGVRVVK